ncbi:MAG: pyroglutamyl-peptidase I [Burkholderiaceae bacterium]
MTVRLPRILLTGFEPFGGEAVNPSWEIARALDGWECEGHVVRAVRLSCVFGEALRELDTALDRHTPALVVCLGQAGGRPEISIERVAINVDDARIPDNQGRQPVDDAIEEDGPAAYFSTLPIKALARDARAAGFSTSVSNTAGTFVCNHVFYALMHRLATRPVLGRARGGFVHVPYTPEQAAGRDVPSMPLATQVEAVRVLLRSALRTRDDIRENAGREH